MGKQIVLHDELLEIFAPLLKLKGISIYVHGSWADNTRTAFSDLDDFIIIDDNFWGSNSPKLMNALNQVELQFQRIDPLQHHGHWLINASTLSNYDNSFIPLFILEGALCLMNPLSEKDIKINNHKTLKGLINNIQVTCKNVLDYFKDYKEGTINIYDLKCLVSSVALIPPLIFQLLGEKRDKATAIQNASSLFSDFELNLLVWATECRNNWELITGDKAYTEFINRIQNFDCAQQWREFAKINAPILNYNALSKIVLTDEIVNGFVNKALQYIDKISLLSKTDDDYSKAYDLVEKESIRAGALLVGQFGKVSHPGISDLDMFICFPDSIYALNYKSLISFIENDSSLSYLFTHEPVIISQSMLSSFKNLHTLNNLKITYASIDYKNENTLVCTNYKLLNNLWTIFLLRIVGNIKIYMKFTDIRTLLLLLKNVHTSLDNILEFKGEHKYFVDRSNDLRNSVLSEGNQIRGKVESEFINSYNFLLSTIVRTHSSKTNNNNLFILNRRTIFLKSETEYKSVIYGKKEMYYLPGVLFDAVFELLNSLSSEAEDYLLSYEKVSLFSKSNGITPPQISPLPDYILLYSKNRGIKKGLFKILNSLPERIKLNLFRVI